MPNRIRLARKSLLVMGALSCVVAVASVVGVWQLSKSRHLQIAGNLVHRVETAAPLIALTFDDGPTREHTRGVLDTLERWDVRATFFVTGKETDENLAIAKAIVEAGHELGNHTYTHPQMVFKSWGFVREQVERTDDAIRRAGQQGTPYFRPPYCKKLVTLPLYLYHTQRTTVTWDIEPESYEDVGGVPQRIAEHVLQRARPGSIVLLHVHYDANEPSRRALPAIIEGLQAQGYHFVTVSELLDAAADSRSLI